MSRRKGRAEPVHADDGQLVSELDHLLRQAVGERMVADVPVGLFLSGGIDSSTVVALMQSQSTRPGSHVHYRVRRARFQRSSQRHRGGATPRHGSHQADLSLRQKPELSFPNCPKSGMSRSPTNRKFRRSFSLALPGGM